MKEEYLRTIGKEVITFVFSKQTKSENEKWKEEETDNGELSEENILFWVKCCLFFSHLDVQVQLEVGLKERPQVDDKEIEEAEEEAEEDLTNDQNENEQSEQEEPTQPAKRTKNPSTTATRKRKQEVVGGLG